MFQDHQNKWHSTSKPEQALDLPSSVMKCSIDLKNSVEYREQRQKTTTSVMHYRYVLTFANIIFSEQTKKGKRNASHCFDAKLLKLFSPAFLFRATTDIVTFFRLFSRRNSRPGVREKFSFLIFISVLLENVLFVGRSNIIMNKGIFKCVNFY